MVKLSLLFAALFTACFSHSQTPNYYNYSTSDGLAGSTIFDICQDKQGYMWFATGNGLSRFDGYTFINYTTGSGLNSNNINAVAAGSENEIYAGNNTGGINVIKNSVITSLNDIVYLNAQNFLLTNRKLYSYSNKHIDIIEIDKVKSIFYNSSVKPLKYYINHVVENNFKNNFLSGEKENSVIVLTNSGLFLYSDTTFIKINVIGADDSVFYSAVYSGNMLVAGAGGALYFLAADTLGKVLRVEKKIMVDKATPLRIQKLFADSKGNIWIVMPSSGFYKLSREGELIHYGRKFGLENTQATKFYEDSEGNIWVGTFGMGVYCITNTFVKSYSIIDGLSNNNVYEIETGYDGSIFCGTFNGLNILSGEKWVTINPNTENNDVYYVHKIKKHNNEIYVCGSSQNKHLINSRFGGYNLNLLALPSFIQHNGMYYSGTWTNVARISNTPDVFSSSTTLNLLGDSTYINRVNEIFADSRGNVWFGTSRGTCLLKGNKKKIFTSDSILSSNINVITEDREGKIFFGGDKGIAVYELNSGNIRSFLKLSGYDLSSISSFAVDRHNKLWVGSNSGLYIMRNDTIRKVDKNVGLFSNEIYSLCYDSLRSSMLIGSNSGLSILDLNSYESNTMPDFRFFIQSVSAGDSLYTAFDKLEFEPEENNVRITYTAMLYSMPKTVEFEYSINGNTRKTESNSIEFTSLQPGNYEFVIRATAPGRKPALPVTLTFNIKPRFTETMWFPLIIFAGVIIAGALISYTALRKVQRREKDKREINTRINELRHQALSAMMNPHFIFNSLNAVQHLVNKGKLTEVNEYISSLARLIRKNLDYADKSYISLAEETDKLKMYLEIENLRFNDKFDFEIIIDPVINPQTCKIPNMIIQPFVENSIWHGLLTLKTRGRIVISFTLENVSYRGNVYKSLTIRIKDNGVGISSAPAKEGHISRGMQLVEERLKLLSEETEIPSTVMAQETKNIINSTIKGNEIKETKETIETPAGTEVIISLPPHLYKL